MREFRILDVLLKFRNSQDRFSLDSEDLLQIDTLFPLPINCFDPYQFFCLGAFTYFTFLKRFLTFSGGLIVLYL